MIEGDYKPAYQRHHKTERQDLLDYQNGKNGTVPNIDRYEMLAAAIVEQAAHDYIAAIKMKDECELQRIERWIWSPAYSRICNIDPEYLIRKLKSMVYKHWRIKK